MFRLQPSPPREIHVDGCAVINRMFVSHSLSNPYAHTLTSTHFYSPTHSFSHTHSRSPTPTQALSHLRSHSPPNPSLSLPRPHTLSHPHPHPSSLSLFHAHTLSLAPPQTRKHSHPHFRGQLRGARKPSSLSQISEESVTSSLSGVLQSASDSSFLLHSRVPSEVDFDALLALPEPSGQLSPRDRILHYFAAFCKCKCV